MKKQGISLIVLIVTVAVMIILATVVIKSITTTTSDADKATFINDITQLEDALNVYYIVNNELPSVGSSYTKEKLIDLVASSNRSTFEQDLNFNADNGATVQFYELDTSVLEVKNLNLIGNGSLGENDKFFFSYPNLNVYYLYGIEVNNIVYFANTSRLTNMTDINNENVTTDTPINVTYNQNITLPSTSTTEDIIAPEIKYDSTTYYNNVKVVKFTVSDNVGISQLKYDYLEKDGVGDATQYYIGVTSFTDDYMLNNSKSVDINSIKSDGRVYLKIPPEVTKITLMAIDTSSNQKRTDVSVNSIYKEPNIITAMEVLAHPKIYYGKPINYTAINGYNSWQIFHSDGDNIYIIASDYIPYKYIPTGKNNSKPGAATGGSTTVDYIINFNTADNGNTTILNAYTGSSDITDERIKKLNNDYFINKKYTSQDNNMKVVAYLLDINAWSDFANKHAEYAIGGPTLQLFCDSYSKVSSTTIGCEAKDSTGYKYFQNGEEWGSSYMGLDEYADTNLYFSKYPGLYKYAIATPSKASLNDSRDLFFSAGTGGTSASKDRY